GPRKRHPGAGTGTWAREYPQGDRGLSPSPQTHHALSCTKHMPLPRTPRRHGRTIQESLALTTLPDRGSMGWGNSPGIVFAFSGATGRDVRGSRRRTTFWIAGRFGSRGDSASPRVGFHGTPWAQRPETFVSR